MLANAADAERRDNRIDVRRHVSGQEFVEPRQSGVVLVEDSRHLVVVKRLGQALGEGIQFPFHLVGISDRSGEQLIDCPAWVQVGILGQEADRQSAPLRHRPTIGGYVASEQPEERALARAVLADQRDPLALLELEIDVGEDLVATMRIRDRGSLNQDGHANTSQEAEKSRSREGIVRGRVRFFARFRAGGFGEIRSGSPQWFFDDPALGHTTYDPCAISTPVRGTPVEHFWRAEPG